MERATTYFPSDPAKSQAFLLGCLCLASLLYCYATTTGRGKNIKFLFEAATKARNIEVTNLFNKLVSGVLRYMPIEPTTLCT